MLNVYTPSNSLKIHEMKTDRDETRNREITVPAGGFDTLGVVRVQPEEQNPQEVCLYQEAEKSIRAVVQAATQVDVGADTASTLAQGRSFFFPWGSLSPALRSPD